MVYSAGLILARILYEHGIPVLSVRPYGVPRREHVNDRNEAGSQTFECNMLNNLTKSSIAKVLILHQRRQVLGDAQNFYQSLQ